MTSGKAITPVSAKNKIISAWNPEKKESFLASWNRLIIHRPVPSYKSKNAKAMEANLSGNKDVKES